MNKYFLIDCDLANYYDYFVVEFVSLWMILCSYCMRFCGIFYFCGYDFAVCEDDTIRLRRRTI